MAIDIFVIFINFGMRGYGIVPMATANIGTIRAECPESRTTTRSGHRLLAEFANAWRRQVRLSAPHFQKIADFRHFSQLARCSQYPLHDRRMVRWSTKGD
jgi:hypothetical protein